MQGKRKAIGILSILFLTILLLGGTYAWLNITKYGTKHNEMTSGSLALVLDDEESEGINLERAIPTSDENGKNQDGYTFSVVNQGTIKTRYKIYLDDLEIEENEVRMPDKAVKYQLLKNEGNVSGGWSTLKEGWITDLGSNPNRLLDSVNEIAGGATNVYTLKVWMDIDAGNEAQDTVFYAKIRIEAEQSNMPVTKSELELTSTSKEKVPIKDGEDPRKYTYTSSDWNVVKVDEDGNIEVIGPGYAVITKTDEFGGKEEITVHVTVPVEATFETNDKIESIGSIENSNCNLTENNQNTCQIDLPEVVVKAGYEFVGWSTDPSSHEGEKDHIEISTDKKILYPIVRKPGTEHQVTFIDHGDGIESIGSALPSCTTEDTYNDEPIKSSCEFTLPEIIVRDGYTVIGWSTDSSATEGITPGSKVEINGSTTFYPIVKKDAITITATFKLNGAASLDGRVSDITKSCEVHTNSVGEPLDECEVAVPEITASTATPIVIGFNEDKNAIEAQIPSGPRTITINQNKTYYAITKSESKSYTITFNRNGATSLGGEDVDTKSVTCNIPATYNGISQKESCKVTSPSIEASTKTPKILGYSTSTDDHSSSWNQNVEKEISSDAIFYAQTANDDEITYTATYQKGSNVTSLERNSDSCSLEASYNGVERETSCTVTAPEITPKVGYTSVGYSKTENDTTGNMNLVLTEDTTFYANAVANSYTIEYYSDGTKVGESGTQVGSPITLMTKEALGISKTGYSFKGWNVNLDATEATYSDGQEVSDLSTTEGDVVKLYAVWIDDIAPVCTFSNLQDSYTVGDIFEVTVTCTDEGSGLAESEELPVLTSSHTGLVDEDGTDIMDYYHFIQRSASCGYENGVLTCSYEVEANGIDPDDGYEYSIIFSSFRVLDQSGNYARSDWQHPGIKGKTFTATPTKDAVDGVATIGSTAHSCTTEYNYRSCSVTLGTDVTVKDGYRWAGWSTDKTATEGDYSLTLTENKTIYPVVGPILADAYTYNQTAAVGEAGRCITGEEDTCEKTTCYQSTDSNSCPAGTIFKYAVKSTYENHRVDSLNDHIHYFHVLHDDGDKVTLQERESIAAGQWSRSEDDITKGPTVAITNLENNTKDWKYVDDMTYTYGTTEFLGNAFTGCNRWNNPLTCDANTYTIDTPISAKSRLATVQEVKNIGCDTYENSADACPLWAYNYLTECYSCTQIGSYNSYWLSNAEKGSTVNAFRIYGNGHIITGPKSDAAVGYRPVIELSKSHFKK